MDNMEKKNLTLNNKEPIPIDRHRSKTNSIFSKIKLLFSLLLVTVILLLIGTYYVYSIPYTSVIVDANSSVSLKLNRWNKVIKTSALDTNGNTLLSDTNLKFKNIDDALVIIVNKAEANNFIKTSSSNQKSSVTIFISGNTLSLPNFYKEAQLKTYDVQINENGNEKFNNFNKNIKN